MFKSHADKSKQTGTNTEYIIRLLLKHYSIFTKHYLILITQEKKEFIKLSTLKMFYIVATNLKTILLWKKSRLWNSLRCLSY